MKSTNYIVIQGWMCNELGLKGNELLVFSLIYGFSQDGKSKFSGGRKYISETFDISLPTVDKILQKLITKKFIGKQSANDYIHTDSYFVTDWVNDGVVKKLYEGSKETLLGGSKETLPNNTNNTNNINKQINKVLSKDNTRKNFDFGVKKQSQKENLYTKCVALIDDKTDNEDVRRLLINWLNMLLEKYRMRGKSLYVNVFKGKLNMLDKFDEQDWGDIVEYNLQKGYEGFYPVSNYNYSHRKPWEDSVECNPETSEDIKEREEFIDTLRSNGKRVEF